MSIRNTYHAQLIAGTAEGRLGGSGVFSGASLSGGLSIFEVEPGLNLTQILKMIWSSLIKI